MILLSYALGFLAVLILIPCCVLVVQVLAALAPPRNAAKEQTVAINLPDVCVLMPAHNEAAGIAKAIESMLPQLSARTRLLVVADNCTDATASTVCALKSKCEFIELVERQNSQFLGKGYALDHGVKTMASNPPDVVVVVDADCEISHNAVQTLSQQCVASKRPVQALYLMRSPENVGVKVKLAEFAWLVKNQVRALGFLRIGLPCQLMGTGMAFTWQQISQAKLASGHIVEDMQLGVDLALAGTPPLFCPNALVTSVFPSTAAGIAAQRTRWEHGHMSIIVSQVPKLLWWGIRRRNMSAFAMAIDLCVPPLSLLTLLISGTFTASLLLAWMGGSVVPGVVSLVDFAMLGMSVISAWSGFGRSVISLWQLFQVPLYVLKKIPMYLYFFVKRQSAWVRSKRDGD